MPEPQPLPDTPAALVTGASRGIGRAIAVELARAGWNVGVNYLGNEKAASQTVRDVEAVGRQAVLCRGDVADPADRRAVLTTFRDAFGRIDALVNNAGISAQERVDLLEMSESSYDRVLATNLKGPHLLSQEVSRWMLEIRSRHPERPLHIVNISSISEYTVSIFRGEYCLAKAALGMLTQLYAQRLAAERIQVNEIRPGIIATDMTAGVKKKYDRLLAEGLAPMRRWGSGEDVARAVRAIVSGDFPYTTGAAFDVDGGFHIRNL